MSRKDLSLSDITAVCSGAMSDLLELAPGTEQKEVANRLFQKLKRIADAVTKLQAKEDKRKREELERTFKTATEKRTSQPAPKQEPATPPATKPVNEGGMF